MFFGVCTDSDKFTLDFTSILYYNEINNVGNYCNTAE